MSKTADVRNVTSVMQHIHILTSSTTNIAFLIFALVMLATTLLNVQVTTIGLLTHNLTDISTN